YRAADAAVGEFDDLVRPAIVVAIGDQSAVEAEIAELVDDDRKPPTPCLCDEVADERGLPRAEKARDDGGGDASVHRAISGCGAGLIRTGMPAATSTTCATADATRWLSVPSASA